MPCGERVRAQPKRLLSAKRELFRRPERAYVRAYVVPTIRLSAAWCRPLLVVPASGGVQR